MTVLIREYRETDRDQLLACIAHLQQHERSLEPDIKAAGRKAAASFLAHFVSEDSENQGKLLVADLDGQIVGFINGYIEEDPSADDLVTHRWFYISDIAVLPGYKGQSIGSRLILEMEKYARSLDISQVQISLLAKNDGAYSFYAKHGYRDYERTVLKTIA